MCELYFEINKRTKAMDKLKKIFLLAFLQFIAVFASAQGIDYFKKANEAFIKGNYTYAVTMYKMYYVETGKNVSELQRQAELCRDNLKKADDAALTKDYATADEWETAEIKKIKQEHSGQRPLANRTK